MIVWFKPASDGVVIAQTGRSVDLPTGATIAPDGLEPHQISLMMLVDGALQPRPLSPVVQSEGSIHTVANCPAGTVIEIYDLTGNERMDLITVAVDGASEIISLPDAGTYSIEVHAPLPSLFTRREVTT